MKGMDRHYQVGIITRTKDRPVMLKRALKSVASQTYKNLVWVIVNDAGERGFIDDIARDAESQGISVVVVHQDVNTGGAAAGNRGIETCEAEYLLLHDDDDTLEPTFLEETIDFLKENGNYCDGVATHTRTIHEIIENDSIRALSVTRGYEPPYADIINMCWTNLFPPISFLFSRRGWEAAGKFDETLRNYSEDWAFNEKYMAHYAVGVLPKILANYHVRTAINDPEDIYSNTMTTKTDRHQEYRRRWMDNIIREDMKNGAITLGQLTLYGQMFYRVVQIHDVIERNRNILMLLETIAKILHHIYHPFKKALSFFRKT